MSGLKHPFKNDIFGIVYKAFRNLYPDKDCECYWYDEFESGEYSVANFSDDGTIQVYVNSRLKVEDAAEVLAHELAHVAVGIEKEHGKEWGDAFDAIFDEYNRLMGLKK